MDKKKIKKIAIVLGVLLLPLIYSITYLKGFWDPYNNLGNMKVAVVNEDKCIKNCKSDDLIKELKDSDSFDFVLKDKDEAEEGLLKKRYFATLTIPEDFTSSLENIDSKDRKTPEIIYRTNKKTNYIASQLIENAVIRVEGELDKQISKEIVKSLSDKLNEVPEETSKISSALGQIYTGSVALNNGAVKLSEGTNTLNDNSKKITEGINTLNEGINTLSEGTSKLTEGASELSSGTTSLKNGSSQILDGVNSAVASLNGQIGDLNTGLGNLTSATESLKVGISFYTGLSNMVLNDFIKSMNGSLTPEEQMKYSLTCDTLQSLDNELGHSIKALLITKPNYSTKTIPEVLVSLSTELSVGASQLDVGADNLSSELSGAFTNIAGEMNTLSQSLNALNQGIIKLDEGVNGENGLINGINRLDSGVKTIYAGSSKLNEDYKMFDNGVSTLNNSVGTLKNGTSNLEEGVNKTKDGVEEGISDTKDKLKVLDGLDKYTKEPVKFKDNSYGVVNDYGTFFSPFFMSLSLWLGGILIIMGLYYDPEKRFTLLGKKSSNRSKRLIYYTLIGIAQSIILPIVLVLVLNFTVTSWLLFFGSCILIGLAFLSIMLFFVFNFDDIGKFLAIVLLVIQLAACAGTFPLETEPTFFKAISPFMPMTYSVELLRESFVSIDSSILVKDALVLFSILVFFGTLILITGYFKTKKEKAS